MIAINNDGRLKSITTNKDLFELDVDIKRSIADSDFKKPIHVPIVLINGQGSSGKDTAIQLLYNQCIFATRTDPYHDDSDMRFKNIMINNISSVDPIRSIKHVTHENDVDEKGDAYRTLIHDIKEAWIKYDHYGPTNYIIGEIKRRLRAASKLPFSEMAATHCFFVHIREKEEIDRFIASLQDASFGCCGECRHNLTFRPYPYTLLVSDELHRFSMGNFSNPADRDVFKIDYDCRIYNNGTLNELQDDMMNFMTQLMFDISIKYISN